MAQLTVWHGEESELYRLNTAVSHNCECPATANETFNPCGPHRMLTDQRVMDHLAFVSEIRARLRRGEGLPECPSM